MSRMPIRGIKYVLFSFSYALNDIACNFAQWVLLASESQLLRPMLVNQRSLIINFSLRNADFATGQRSLRSSAAPLPHALLSAIWSLY